VQQVDLHVVEGDPRDFQPPCEQRPQGDAQVNRPDHDRVPGGEALRVLHTNIRGLDAGGRQQVEPQRFNGDLSLFVAMENQSKPPVDNWRAYVGGQIKVHPIDCAHDNMMDPIPAAKIGKVLARELNREPATSQTPSQRKTT